MRIQFEDLDEHERDAVERALEVRIRAYAPYSHFLVGAAVLTRSGGIHLGANLENASYGLTVCAEVAALARALAEDDYEVTRIVIVGGPSGGPSSGVVMPCGRCRQLIFEAGQVSATDVLVVSLSLDGAEIDQSPISALLPGAFHLPVPEP